MHDQSAHSVTAIPIQRHKKRLSTKAAAAKRSNNSFLYLCSQSIPRSPSARIYDSIFLSWKVAPAIIETFAGGQGSREV